MLHLNRRAALRMMGISLAFGTHTKCNLHWQPHLTDSSRPAKERRDHESPKERIDSGSGADDFLDDYRTRKPGVCNSGVVAATGLPRSISASGPTHR